jgi:hypothetical protein
MMNPETNRFEPLTESEEEERKNQTQEIERRLRQLQRSALVRPDGSPVPDHWGVYTEGELIEIKNHTFKVVHIGEAYLVLEPVGPVVVGQSDE